MNYNFVTMYNRYKAWLKPEALEQARVVMWLEDNLYRFTAIPNSTWTTSFKQKTVNYLTGVRPGLCDLLVVLKGEGLLFIELKRPREILKSGKVGASKSSIGADQTKWIETLNKVGNVHAEICYGAEEAIALVLQVESILDGHKKTEKAREKNK